MLMWVNTHGVDLEVLGVYTPIWTHLGPPPGDPYLGPFGTPVQTPYFQHLALSRGTPIWTHLGPLAGPLK
jgi:hypothetical protein